MSSLKRSKKKYVKRKLTTILRNKYCIKPGDPSVCMMSNKRRTKYQKCPFYNTSTKCGTDAVVYNKALKLYRKKYGDSKLFEVLL